MEANLRLRLVFGDRSILSESQRAQRLKRSLVLLNPRHETISELADHLIRVFDLSDSCSDGLVLSIDGFVLPPFESTSILKETDVIRVNKKHSNDIVRLTDGTRCYEVVKVAEVEPVNGGMKLLASEEFEKESGGYRSDTEEGEPEKLEDIDDLPKKTVSKKRKASKKLTRSNDRKKRKKSTTTEEGFDTLTADAGNEAHPELNGSSHRQMLLLEKSLVENRKPSHINAELDSSRKKRKKSATTEEGLDTLPGDAGNEVHTGRNGSSHGDILLLEKSSVENGKPSHINAELDSSSCSDTDERGKKVEISMPSDLRSCQVQENHKQSGVSSESRAPDGSKKLPSRSSQRKKIRRKMQREQAKFKRRELRHAKLDKTDNQQLSGKDNSNSVEEHQQLDEYSGEDGEIVPVVVRPGHIRFEPFNKVDADQPIQHHEISVETFHWNGITSKKKGQKWGTEKTVSYKRSDQNNLNLESSDMLVNEEETTEKVSLDFNTLQPCITLPQEGDTLAYRLIELSSSSWTPEVSSYRVGKVSKYDPKSEKLTLVQVPEYPIIFEKNGDEESAENSDMSPYNEDGSLEIDYPSLVDVRIVKHGNLSSDKSLAPVSSKATGGDQRASASRSRPNSKKQPKGKQPKISRQENGKETSWDDVCAALEAKKAQLAKVDNWTRTGSTSGNSWSYRALRGSALGPTMAILRAENGL